MVNGDRRYLTIFFILDVDVGYLYLLQRNLVAEHTEIYRNVADGDTFF